MFIKCKAGCLHNETLFDNDDVRRLYYLWLAYYIGCMPNDGTYSSANDSNLTDDTAVGYHCERLRNVT